MMRVPLTIPELAERLAREFDEIELLDILDINIYEIVERFADKIELKYDELLAEVEQDIEEDSIGD